MLKREFIVNYGLAKHTFLFFAFVMVLGIPSSLISSISDRFGDGDIAYGQINEIDSKNVDSLDVQGITTKKVHVGDIDIAYKTFGQGDPILLISGSGNVMDVWPLPMLQELSSNQTVVIFDNRGVGNTTLGTKPNSVEQMANDTIGLLDALKIQKADVLGFSMGSFVAEQLAITSPDKVNRLILYGASCGGQEGVPQRPEVAKIISDFVNNRTQDVNAFLSVTFPPDWIKTHPDYFTTIPRSSEIITSNMLVNQFNIVEDWLSRDWNGVCNQLSTISKPVLIIVGNEDVAVPADNALILAQNIPGSWLVQMRDAGHGLMYQYPQQFTNILEAFLEIIKSM